MNTTINLSTRLEQYESTIRGETIRGETTRNHNVSEIAGFVAAAGAGLAMAGAADAAIIYSGVKNISVSINPAYQATSPGSATTYSDTTIDMDGGGADVNLQAFFFGTLSVNIPAVKYIGGASLSAIGGAAFLGTGGGVRGGSNLAASNNIGPGGVFGTIYAGQARGNIMSFSTSPGSSYNISYGNFAPGSTGFVGIQLGSGNFGWIRLRVDELGLNQPFSDLSGGNPIGDGLNYADQLTVIDWAYETSGAAIHVGDTGSVSVPAPTPLALLAAGAVGIAAFRRRKAVIQTS